MGSFKQDLKETYLGLKESFEDKRNDFVQFLHEAWPLLTLLLAILIGIWLYADPPPPRHVMMAAGSPGGSYEVLGKKYAEFFKAKGVTLELVPTEGAQENINRLIDRNDPVQAAFVQSGVMHAKDLKGVQSLGAINYDPIWFFYRGPELHASDFEAVDGKLRYFLTKKISIGTEGSGTHAQAMRILKVTGFEGRVETVTMSAKESVKALQNGEIDGVFIVDAFDAPNVQTLLNDPSLHISSFKRAEAYLKLIPYLHILEVPQGSFSLERNYPSSDMKLLATTTNILIDDRMHPAIQFLFLQAAKSINGKDSFFAKRGEFPSFKDSVLEESPVAVHFEKNNYPILTAYFPFWIAELVNRLVFVLLPFCVLAYPILQSLPGYRTKRMQNKINRLYGELKSFEQDLLANFDPAKLDDYLKTLDLLEYQALNIKVSKRLSSDYYTLRSSIDFVRSCLKRGVRPYQMKEPIDINL